MIVYSLPTCGQCKVLKSKLDEKCIKYEVIEDINVIKEKGICGVPVLELDNGELLTQIKAIKFVDSLASEEL